MNSLFCALAPVHHRGIACKIQYVSEVSGTCV